MVDPISVALEASSLSAVFASGSGVGLSALTTLGTVSSIGAYALVGGAVVGGAVFANALAPKQHSDNQLTIKQAVPPRTRCYGRALLGGAYFFFGATSVLVSGFVLCEGPIDAFEEHWFSGVISPDGGALIGHADVYPWYQYIDFQSQLGTADQTTNSFLAAIFGPYGNWTATDRLRGLAVTVMRCFLPNDPAKNFSKRYPSGVPSYLARIRGSRVFDPRDASQNQADATTWKWSQNPSLCIMDYLTSPRGMSIPARRMNLAAFVAMANLCDEAVPLGANGQAADGSTASSESRYLLWGTYTLDEEPKAVLERMLKTCDGELYPIADGTIGLRGGAWTPPTVTIDDSMILSLDASRGVDKLARFNQLKIRTTSVYNQFQVVEGDPWDDIAAQQASGEVLPQDFDLVMVPSYTQGCRLAKIAMAKGNPAWICTVTTSLAGLQALGERTVHLRNADFGIDDDMFVSSFEIGEDGASCKIGLGSLSAAAYAWSTAEEGNPAPASGMTSTLPYIPPAVTGFAAVAIQKKLTASTSLAELTASVSAPADLSLELSVQYRALGDAAWIDMVVDNATYTATSSPVTDNTTYEVRAAFESYGGSLGPYAAPIQVRAVSGALGPIAQALAAGANMDFGTLDQGVTASDDFGVIGDTVFATLDLGTLNG